MSLMQHSSREYNARIGVWATHACDSCGAVNVAQVRVRELLYNSEKETINQGFRTDEITWFPRSPAGKDFPDVPDSIAETASEAYSCASIQAFRGALLLARAAIEATAKEKGVTSGNLKTKIVKLGEDGVLRPHVVETAHLIRDFGNSSAHADEMVVTEAEATLVLDLMDEVLNEVFQSPEKLKRARAAIDAAKSGA